MKQLTLTLLIVSSLLSCKKEDDKPTTTTPAPYTCPTCVTTPEAKAEHDGGSGGVYKGVIVGSTGTIALYLYNTGTEVKALVSFDGKNATLTTQDLPTWQPGDPIAGAEFTGKLDGKDITAIFSCGPEGQLPAVTLTIPGHTVKVAVYKETSTALVKNYEGTYTGDNDGTFNMAFDGDDYSIVVSGGNVYLGSLVNGQIDYHGQNGLEIKGSFNGDDVSGTWKNTSDNTDGTWSGKRTL